MAKFSLYRPDLVGKLYVPKVAQAILEGQGAKWGASGNDKNRVALLIVDAQVDFVHEDGALSVPGAIGDIQRLIDLIYHEGRRITSMVPTVDTHSPFMIFFPTWWRDSRGIPPDPYTIITEESVHKGIWRAVIDPAWSSRYVSQLTKAGKKQLMIWPFHTMDMTPGINVVPPLVEAIMFHSAARFSQPFIVHKGHIPQVEFYSPLRPEVDVPGIPGGAINTSILNVLAGHDEIWVAGEAKSHCVLEAMRTLVEYFGPNQPEVLKRIVFLSDCTSSVKHPQVDFEAIASAALEEMSQKYGIRLVKSTDLYR